MVTQGEKALAPHLHTDGLICIQTGLICIGSVGHIPKFPTPVLASQLPSQRPLPSPSAPSGLDLSVSKRGPTLRHTAPTCSPFLDSGKLPTSSLSFLPPTLPGNQPSALTRWLAPHTHPEGKWAMKIDAQAPNCSPNKSWRRREGWASHCASCTPQERPFLHSLLLPIDPIPTPTITELPWVLISAETGRSQIGGLGINLQPGLLALHSLFPCDVWRNPQPSLRRMVYGLYRDWGSFQNFSGQSCSSLSFLSKDRPGARDIECRVKALAFLACV